MSPNDFIPTDGLKSFSSAFNESTNWFNAEKIATLSEVACSLIFLLLSFSTSFSILSFLDPITATITSAIIIPKKMIKNIQAPAELDDEYGSMSIYLFIILSFIT